MKSERSWAGIICGFVLFIVVCLSLLLHMKGAFRASGKPGAGPALLFAARAAASCLSPGRRVLRPLLGAILAAPVCMVTMRLFFVTHRTFLAGDGVGVERRVLVRAWGIVLLFICAWLDTWRSPFIEQIN
ncbi:inner membrane protein [Klebsiella pneumoniae]|uniref:Inner membrane protein n=1 Tax=Klebsiella pneumoniae TaxID=573 RepID=A0A3S4KN76_KLEPN|nr:inner membrane protein [Klebsiella pneumoniae]